MRYAKTFHLGDILSIITGRLVSPRHIDGVHDILNWMTGDNLFTHQLPRACAECAPGLLAQHPSLADVETPGDFTSEAQVTEWLETQMAWLGRELPVSPLAAEDHTHIDPLTELHAMRPDGEVIVVEIPGDES